MEAFKEVVGEVLGETVSLQPEEEPIDMTRQFTPEEVAELQARIEELATKELAEFEAQQNQQTEESDQHEEPVEVEATAATEDDANKESVLIL